MVTGVISPGEYGSLSFLIDFVLLRMLNGFGLPLLLVGVGIVGVDKDCWALGNPVSSEVDKDTSDLEGFVVMLTGFLVKIFSPT
jgi:hypothetical protein